jgi:acyl-CoA thioester hydrolase
MRSEDSSAPFEVRERVRWADVDSAGIIWFGAYARFIEIAEAEFFRALGFSYQRFSELGVYMPRVHLEFNFYKPALLDDELILRTTLTGIGPHSVRLKISIARAGDEGLLADAAVVIVSVDRSHKKIPVPESLAETLESNLSRA